MNQLARLTGILRSLLIYYGIPFRAKRMQRFYTAFVTPDSLCFDIGAHAGNRTRCWRRLGARVVAVEPQPDFAAILRLLFGRDSGVSLEEVAVGDSAGTGRMLISPRTPTVTTLSRAWADQVGRSTGFNSVSWSEQKDVALTTLQALIDRYGMPDFIKLDIEGSEAAALEGLSSSVAVVSFEYLPAARETALQCIERLSTLGNYQYNRSEGESHQLALTDWVDAEAMRLFLLELPENASSGDIYARQSSVG